MSNIDAAPVFISSEVAAKTFGWGAAIEALQATYERPFTADATPPRTVARSEKAWLRTLPAIPPGGRYFGAKLMGMDGAGSDPGAQYVIVLFDRQTSRIAAFLDGNMVTAYRTAATSAAALDRLAPAGASRLAVLGSGLEGAMHARAFANVRALDEIRVFSPTPERREAFAAAVTHDLGIKAIAATSAEDAVRGADIVLAAARSKGEVPILYADWLAPGATVVSIGSTIPQQREIDVSVVELCDLIVCDMREEVIDETGDMIAAEHAGIVFQDKCFSLSDLMTGKLGDRVSRARNPMFKSVGGGMQDIVVAEMILNRALAAGLATPLPIHFDTKR